MTFNNFSLFSMLLSTTLAGCAIVGTGTSENLIEIPNGKGIALFSTGIDKPKLPFIAYLTLVDGRTLKEYDRVIISFDPSNSDSNQGVINYKVRSLTLPAGEYYFKPSFGNLKYTVTDAPIYKFNVKANKVNYLGSIQLSGALLQYGEDFQKRDLAYFQQKNPSLPSASYILSPLEMGPKFSDFHTTGTIWDAP